METTKTEMTNPPAAQTKAVAPKKSQKTYKLFVLKPFQLGNAFVEGQPITDAEAKNTLVKPGDIIEVTKERAVELCKKRMGSYNFAGERYETDGSVTRHDKTRARLATEQDLVASKTLTPMDEEDFQG